MVWKKGSLNLKTATGTTQIEAHREKKCLKPASAAKGHHVCNWRPRVGSGRDGDRKQYLMK